MNVWSSDFQLECLESKDQPEGGRFAGPLMSRDMTGSAILLSKKFYLKSFLRIFLLTRR
jgi:hypothetical protein